MIEGLFELFDEMADLALNRVVSQTKALEGGFNPLVVSQDNVDRFKIAWFVIMGELMLREMRGGKVEDVRESFYGEMNYIAGERDAVPFLEETTERVRDAIAGDDAFNQEGVFNRLLDGNGSGPKNSGLGPDLAAMLAQISFAENDALAKIFAGIQKTVEDEFINAYGHSSLACAKFEVV